MPDREGWPEWAVERVECANCGGYGYSRQSAPHDRGGPFQKWLRRVWPDGVAEETQFGFVVFCGGRCCWTWRRGREQALERQESDVLAHQREMDRRRLKVGLG